MECQKWNNGRDKYINLCKIALEDNIIFNNLKNNKNYGMVEKFDKNYKICGEWLINILFKKYPKNIDLLEIGIENDKFLNPVKFDYSYLLKNKINLSTYQLSYCCISYVIKALNIITHMKTLNINKFNIVEIGGGYGGQAFVLVKLAKIYNMNINTYSIFDLEYPSLIQNKYINLTNLRQLCIFNTYYKIDIDKNITNEFNFLISNYAFSEISTQIQNLYINNILYNVKHGFILWNFLNKENINPYFQKINKGNFDREECNPNKMKNSLEIKY